MTRLECPCGIHPADCTYHRDTLIDDLLDAVYGSNTVSSRWGETLAREFLDLRKEYAAICKQIQAAHASIAGADPEAPCATTGVAPSRSR